MLCSPPQFACKLDPCCAACAPPTHFACKRGARSGALYLHSESCCAHSYEACVSGCAACALSDTLRANPIRGPARLRANQLVLRPVRTPTDLACNFTFDPPFQGIMSVRPGRQTPSRKGRPSTGVLGVARHTRRRMHASYRLHCRSSSERLSLGATFCKSMWAESSARSSSSANHRLHGNS